MSEYFHSSANYEDDNSLYYSTDFRLGDSILDEWEDSTITDVYNDEVDDPNDRAINVEDIVIISGLSKYFVDEPTTNTKSEGEKFKEVIRQLVRQGASIREATRDVFANASAFGVEVNGPKEMLEMIARNEGRIVHEEIKAEKLAKFIKERNKRMAAERAKHPQKYLKTPTSNKGFNVPKGR